MFSRKKKAVFENGNNHNNSVPVNPSPKSVSYDQFYPSDKMSKSKMLSPPPPVPVPQPPPPQTTMASDSSVAKQLVFHCQLAHGSQTGFITGFSSVRELYQKIADYYEFPVEEVQYRVLIVVVIVASPSHSCRCVPHALCTYVDWGNILT